MEQAVFDLRRPERTYLRLALPVVLGMIVTLIYNLADTYFIARTGDAALVAGVSLCSPVFTALMAFGNIFGQGGSSLISRLLGGGDARGVRRVSAFCFYAAAGTGVALAAGLLALRRPMLALIGADATTVAHASSYFSVLAAGAPIVILSFIHSNLLRCEGLATLSMLGTSAGALLNIALDPIFISGFGWGARGAAIATVLGYAFSDAFFLVVLRRRSRFLSVDPRGMRVSGGEVRQILSVGGSAAITNLAQSLSLVAVNQFLLPYGSEKIAAMGIVLKINMIAQLMLVGFAFGGVPLFGFLCGAGDREKLSRLIRFCLCFLCGLALALSAILFALAPRLMRAFIDVQAIVSDGALMLRWQTAGNVFAAVVLLMTCLFQASGRALPAFALSISRQGALFILVLVAAVALFGYGGLLRAQTLADLLSAALAVWLYTRAFGTKNEGAL